LPPEDKEKAMKLLELDMIEMQEVSKRWTADMASTSWLSKNVRPLILVFFSVSYVVGWYLDYSLDSITGLLSLIVGAYFGSRGVEKVMGNNRHK
jgi:SNF family Na+-dependent transporter